MSTDNLVFVPSFSLNPNYLTIYNSVFRKVNGNSELVPIQQKIKHETQPAPTIMASAVHDVQLSAFTQTVNGEILPAAGQNRQEFLKPCMSKKTKKIDIGHNLKRSFHNFTISDNANRTLRNKINWLYYLAKSKRIKSYSGKEIFNFKIGFITLTLPSKQLTPTIECNQKLLNTFLTEIRQRTSMENYVWRLEFQGNGNVHYHLVTDTYIDYYLAQKIWNKILEFNGYIQPFREKMNQLSLSDYVKKYDNNGKVDYSTMVKRYARGKRENWSQPNSVDVKSVISNKAIANYISKYFSKESKSGVTCNELDTAENSKNLRLWFCSRSLSKLKSVSNFCDAVSYDIEAIMSYCEDKREVFLRYTKVIYYTMKTFSHTARMWIEKILKDYSKKQGYVPSS